MPAEQRRYPRARVFLPVVIHRGAEPPVHAVATDLSEGGVFLLETLELSAAGEAAVELAFGDERLRLPVRVVRKQELSAPRGLDVPGLGLAFQAVPETFARALANHLAGAAAAAA